MRFRRFYPLIENRIIKLKREYNHIEDFLEDASFRGWVLSKGKQRNLFWESWPQNFPEKASVLLEAKEILLALNTKEREWKEEDQQGVLSSINQIIDGNQPVGTFRSNNQKIRLIWMRAAVILAIITLSALAIWEVGWISGADKPSVVGISQKWVVKSTDSGEKKRVRLPDGSNVTMNSSSEIRYREGFGQVHRDIILEGESLFEVAKDSLIPFSVKSGKLTTVALGTSFNVKGFSKERITQVRLISGKVKVENENDPGFNNDLFFLTAGEEALLTPSDFKKTKFNQTKALLWTEGILFFDNTPFSEVVPILERWYGVQITVAGNLEEEAKISGEFNRDNLENVLKSISYSFHFNFQINDKKVFISFNQKKETAQEKANDDSPLALNLGE